MKIFPIMAALTILLVSIPVSETRAGEVFFEIVNMSVHRVFIQVTRDDLGVKKKEVNSEETWTFTHQIEAEDNQPEIKIYSYKVQATPKIDGRLRSKRQGPRYL